MSLLEKECVALSPQLGPLRILPLHAGLGGSAQRIYESEPDPSSPGAADSSEGGGSSVTGAVARRKVVVTDALAEASFSLPAVRYVIDTGLQLASVSVCDSRCTRSPVPPSPVPPSPVSPGLQPSDQSQLPHPEAHQQRPGGHEEAAGQQPPSR